MSDMGLNETWKHLVVAQGKCISEGEAPLFGRWRYFPYTLHAQRILMYAKEVRAVMRVTLGRATVSVHTSCILFDTSTADAVFGHAHKIMFLVQDCGSCCIFSR
jgi:hypothetical protein